MDTIPVDAYLSCTGAPFGSFRHCAVAAQFADSAVKRPEIYPSADLPINLRQSGYLYHGDPFHTRFRFIWPSALLPPCACRALILSLSSLLIF